MIGFIGLGIMGRPMAKNLLKAGFQLMVFDLNQEAVSDLVSCGAVSGSYVQIGETCDPILLILPNGDIVQQVLFGPNGVVGSIRPGTVVCDMSSVTPTQSRTCFEKLQALHVSFVDAPVSGGETGAIDGSLAIMCGGEKEAYERLLPVFETLGKSSLLLGGSGAGSVTKLANQIIVNMNIATVAEALVFATAAGADPMKVYEAIRGGLAGSKVLDQKAPMMCDRNFKPGGKIAVNHKDIKNVIETAHTIGVPIPFTASLFEVFQTLKTKGYMNDDHAALVRYWEALSGTEVRTRNE